ncbi:class B sortase [[Clostridium] scindens]|uniref:class B sortase n=1 Tax=Lachnospiraceae TaxID=186803 RepID=UPI00298D1F19|nr:class B sortase [[Clostridium] scindens]
MGVDYPVVQGEDNEYHLHHMFRKEANKAESIFLDYRNRADFRDYRVIIYGHNMKDDSMFSNLKK